LLFAAQGLQGFLAAQGLAAWQGLAAAQGLAAQGLHGFLTAAAQGLAAQGLAAQGLQGLQAAICTEVPAAWLAASGSATAPAETVATLRATRVFFSMDFASNHVRTVGRLLRKEKLLLDAAPPEPA
jgi:hypothetical protein